MASTSRRRVNSNSDRTEIHTYVDGSTARQVHVHRRREQNPTPVRQSEHIRRHAGRRETGRNELTETTTVSRTKSEKNRAKANNLGLRYVLFLAGACLFTMFMCVQYLNLKSTLTTQNEKIATAESKLNSMRADNDAYYNQVMASVTLEDIKDAALQYGMHYATESQIEYYSIGDSSYMRQYQDIPE